MTIPLATTSCDSEGEEGPIHTSMFGDHDEDEDTGEASAAAATDLPEKPPNTTENEEQQEQPQNTTGNDSSATAGPINNGSNDDEINGDEEDNDDEDDEEEFYGVGARGEARKRKILHWKKSPFAVGLVNVTWQDDRPSWVPCGSQQRSIPPPARDIDENFVASSIVCGCLGAKRVGNFSVLAQRIEDYDEPIQDPGTGEITGHRQTQRPKLLCVIGPYWVVNIFITFPIILVASGWVCYRRIVGAHIAIIITWSIGTVLLIFSLLMISCRDPGILYRRSQPPPGAENWRWNDQARTYRPPKARFDPECQAVIHGFDHTCPWTGTAIGAQNMRWFRVFVTMVFVMMLYSIVLAITGGFSFLQ